MQEIYKIAVDKSRISFEPTSQTLPDFIFSNVFNPDSPNCGIDLVTRMGSPDVVHCVIFRFRDKPGGIFAMHDNEGFMFAAVADTNLAYCLAKGFFGELTANARAGVDIFEDLGNTDD